MADAQRRHVLYELSEADAPVSITHLTAAVATWTPADGTGTQCDEQTIQRDLVETQLPYLEKHGVVDYDTDQQVVTYSGEFPALGLLLEHAKAYERDGTFLDTSTSF